MKFAGDWTNLTFQKFTDFNKFFLIPLLAALFRSVPQWLKITSDEVKDQIFKLAKKGLTPSQIGVILRDSHGVAQVEYVYKLQISITCSY